LCAEDPLNLIRVMPAKGATRVAAKAFEGPFRD